MKIVAVVLAVVSVASAALGQEAKGGSDPKAIAATKLVFLGGNFMRTEEVDRCLGVMKLAAEAGYTGLLVTDCKFDRWDEAVTVQRPAYEQNVKRLRQAARDLKLQFIACVCGQNADLLSNDPNLAEAMPVKNAPFLVKGGKLVPADADFAVVNPGLEASANGRVPGWNVDEVGSVDTEVKVEGKNSIRFQDIKAKSPHGNGRVNQAIKVQPFRYYHLSLQIKTQDFDAPGTFNVAPIALVNGNTERALAHQTFELKPTQDWTKYDVVFNTLDNDQVGLYIGSWGGNKGKLWLDDLRLEPGGFVNLIRRDSLTFKLTSEDGQTVYEEGKDLPKVVDPRMGNTDFPGAYKLWYEGPVVTLPPTSRLSEGQKVLVSYNHAMSTYGYGVFACWNEPKMWQIMEKNLKSVHEVLQPDGYMMTHDEIRHMGWDEPCLKTGKTCGQMLAENVKRCTALIRQEDPGKPIYAWNDMFDPNHNAGAKGKYYLVRGEAPFVGAWEGLDKDVIIMNWAQAQEPTLKWFAERGHKQILCGYYDQPSEKMADWMKLAVKYPNVVGVMYTTWANDFKELGKYAKVVAEYKVTE